MTDDLLNIAGDVIARARKLGADAAVASVVDGVSTDVEMQAGAVEKLERSEGRRHRADGLCRQVLGLYLRLGVHL